MVTGTGSATDRPGPAAAEHPHARPGAAEGVRARRERLGAALHAFSVVLDSGATDPVRWVADVHDALRELRTDWHEHIARSESADGLLAQVREDAPWMSPRVDRVAHEHEVLSASIDEALAAWDADASPAEVEARLRPVLHELTRHRERGTELLMDAYGLDLAAGD